MNPVTPVGPARVVECFGRRMVVALTSGERVPAVVFGKRLHPVCGDEVRVAVQPGSDEWQVVALEPRRSLIARMDSRGRSEPMVANATRLAVIIAAEPAPDLYMVDRYLAGAAFAGIHGMVIINKADLDEPESPVAAAAGEYEAAGFPVARLSARTGTGIDSLRAMLRTGTTLLVGQSGVGKSTLCNLLVPAALRPTRALSASTGEGVHTTVAATLLTLPDGGELIDSPGVRDFAPAPVAEVRIQEGWPEILRLAEGCRFKDCLHLREPGCAITAAVAARDLSTRRYEGYRRLVNLMRQLVPAHERPRH